jgi:rhamnogalacturonan endolyase
MPQLHRLFAFALDSALLLGYSNLARAQNAPVTLTEDEKTWTLDNGIVKAMVAKESGDLVSLRYKDMEILATFYTEDGSKPDLKRDPPGENREGLNRTMTDHQYGFWSHDAMGQRDTKPAVAKITIDPKSNNGERAEVSVFGDSSGRLMGTGPGAGTSNFAADVQIRWALGRGDSGVYTYCQFEHKPDYPASTITEARFCAKLADYFDWMSVAQTEHHNKYYPASLREGDKYVYTTNQYKNPAFGWSSTTKNVGFFIINPSNEYMSGGPTKIEFLGHRDTNQIAAPCVLNYWRSSHYGGAQVSTAAGEQWTKVIGPFMLYVTSGADPQTIYKDARDQAAVQQQKWPFDWVQGVSYPTSKDRVTVKGRFALNDPQAKTTQMRNLMVGLTAPAYPAGGGFGGARMVGWQQDAKNYQFWVPGKEDGSFEIPNVRPGTYELHAFTEAAMEEFVKSNITVEAARPLDLGTVDWNASRFGKQIWEIGIPNRLGVEFLGGPEHWQTNSRYRYAELFPNDITYTIGKSDFTKDWYYAHVPHASANAPAPARGGGRGFGRGPATAPAAGAARRGGPGRAFGGPTTGPAIAGAPTTGPARAGRFGGRGPAFPTNGFAAPRTIVFEMPDAPKGKATLRATFSATGTSNIPVTVNGQELPGFTRLPQDRALDSHGQHGIWHEEKFEFDASLLKQGTNQLVLTVPAGSINAGVIYDYLRLEVDENAQPAAPAAQ